MNGLLSPPAPLPDPPGSLPALDELVGQLASAGYAAGLTVHLLGSAGVVPGWQGADADAAAAEVAAATAVAGELHAALVSAWTRLGEHREVWQRVLARVAALREQQRADFADAAVRIGVLVGPALERGDPGPGEAAAQELAGTVATADDARAAEHRALLAALAEDAADTARLLAAALGSLGGDVRPGSAAQLTARLAARLPGWGEAALADLGGQAAGELSGRLTAAELEAAAARWTAYAEVPAFVEEVLGRLGADGVGWLLTVLGTRATGGQDDALTALLATVVATATAAGGRGAQVLAAVRLDRDDPDGAVDLAGIGMGLVLGGVAARGGPVTAAGLAAGWGRQLLDREGAQGAGAVARTAATLPDPLVGVLRVVVAGGDPAAAARLLGTARSWSTLTSRSWPDGAADLAAAVRLAAGAPTAGQVAAAGLGALGQGLAPGSTDRVVVDPEVLAVVGAPLADLVAGQPDVVVPLLAAASDAVPGALAPETDAALRGLAHLLTDAARDEVVTTALAAALAGGAAGTAAPAVAGGHVAVQEHAQRLTYALEFSRAQSRAVDVQMVWTIGVDLPVTVLARGPAEDLVGAVLDGAAGLLDADGEVDLGPDLGRVRTAADAQRWAVQTLGGGVAGAPVGAAAEEGFTAALQALGTLSPPEPGPLDWVDDLPFPDQGDRQQPRKIPRR
ncbi:hypothetical protein [Modestobacter italicus]|uniref:hypothetical protein n=1 Tax=Modestobacter italicus (strain DSM 44449 / CECT 9708 / BC 501) TaxID=2732864 RepID=UPI001C946336|nr:hypothetical protein [Modestobacter italicus]